MAPTSLTFIQVLIVLSLLQTFTAFTWNTKYILNRRRCLCRNVPNVPLQAEWERFEGCDICFPDDPDLVCGLYPFINVDVCMYVCIEVFS